MEGDCTHNPEDWKNKSFLSRNKQRPTGSHMHIYIRKKKHLSYFMLNCVHFRPTVSEEKMFNSFYTNDSPLCICIL